MTTQTFIFSVDEPAVQSGDFVLYRNCKVFEAGEYPDRNLTITQADIAAMAQNFTHLYGDLEHILDKTPPDKLGTLKALEGKLGDMPSLWVDPTNPSVLRADIRVPKWLDPVLPAKDVSVAFAVDDPTRLTRYTITQKGRVPDASLVSTVTAAFSAFSGGLSKAEAIQTKKETKSMTFKDIVKAWFDAGTPDDFAPPALGEGIDAPTGATPTQATFSAPTAATVPTPAPTTDPQLVALMSQFEAEKASAAKRIAELEAESRQQKAVVAFNARADRLYPAHQHLFTAIHTTLSDIESVTPRVITFSDSAGKEQTSNLLALFTSFVDSLPPHGLQTALGGDNTLALLPGSVQTFSGPVQDKETMDKAVDAALAMTDLGKKALAARKNGNH